MGNLNVNKWFEDILPVKSSDHFGLKINRTLFLMCTKEHGRLFKWCYNDYIFTK